ncbi:MAG TPA: porin family protein [Puia sp.]|nr:porin family protein [Puia sp.]
MKKLTLLLALSTIVTFARAQAKLRLGVSAGLNETAYNLYTLHSDWKSGLHAGIFGELPVAQKIGIEADLLYSAKGGSQHSESGVPSSSERLNYLSLPILCNFHLTNRFTVQAGPEISVLLSASYHSGNYSGATHGLFRSFDSGIAAGIFYDLPAGFSVGIRYIQGFKPITKELTFSDVNGNTLSSGAYGNNMAAQLTVHYTLRQSKGL